MRIIGKVDIFDLDKYGFSDKQKEKIVHEIETYDNCLDDEQTDRFLDIKVVDYIKIYKRSIKKRKAIEEYLYYVI